MGPAAIRAIIADRRPAAARVRRALGIARKRLL
jgi:hypothetical protein